MIFSSKSLICIGLVAMASPASAYLGSFEGGNSVANEPDGYHRHNVAAPGNSGANGVEAQDIVSTYNAGAYNTNGGGPGGTYTFDLSDINTLGNWTDLNATGAAPSYYGINYYVISHREVSGNGWFAYDGDAFLGLRNDTGHSNPATDFQYAIDSSDLGGAAPSSTGDKVVEWSIWACPTDATGAGDGYFHWTFKDNSGNTGFQLGYDGNAEIQYRASTSDTWTSTGFSLDETDWDNLKLSFDLENDTWGLDVYDTSAGMDVEVVAAGQSFGENLSELSTIDWHLDTYGTSVKNFFDESTFTVVPEPSTSLIGLITIVSLFRSRELSRRFSK